MRHGEILSAILGRFNHKRPEGLFDDRRARFLSEITLRP
jgi:hypothetical protein